MFSYSRSYIEFNFKKAIQLYESIYLSNYAYKKYKVSKDEVVFCVEDSFVLYICIEQFSPFVSETQYHIKFEELLPNTIFPFTIRKFENFFDDAYYLIFYKKFYGLSNPMQKSLISSTTEDTINRINKLIPKLNLLERIHSWEGFAYTSIFFKIDSGQSITYGNYLTQCDEGYKIAYRKCKDLEDFYLYSFLPERNHLYSHGYMFDKNVNITLQQIKLQRPLTLHNKIYFWFKREYLYDICDIKGQQIKYLDEFLLTDLFKMPPYIYDVKPTKWKSEYLAFELTQKIYGKENVTFQYRPFFLNFNGHQLSYDIFIPKKKIAIEYQGKQHFEPIDYFGGQIAFEQQQRRDKIKANLSKENNIKLVYLSYWEDLSIETIKKKIREIT